jgi:PAS domain S-box-containing protein
LSNSNSADPPAARRRDRGSFRASAGGAFDGPNQLESRLAQLLADQAGEFAAALGSDGRVLHANPAICDYLGYSQQEFLGLYIWNISPWMQESWPARLEELKNLISQIFVVELHSRTGEIFPVQLAVNYSASEDEGFVLCLGRRLETLPTGLSGRLLELQDEERRRIARQLHDTTGQNLGALRIGLSMLLANGAIDRTVRKAIEDSIALADTCVREIRDMSNLLHPPLLDELGLVPALRNYCGNYTGKTGIPIELDLPFRMRRLPQAVEIALFRIVQEGLANIHHHSGSEMVTLRLKHESGQVHLELTSRVLPAVPTGLSIAAMRERARQLGGLLTIAPAETGTTIRVIVPTLHTQQLDASVGRS